MRAETSKRSACRTCSYLRASRCAVNGFLLPTALIYLVAGLLEPAEVGAPDRDTSLSWHPRRLDSEDNPVTRSPREYRRLQGFRESRNNRDKEPSDPLRLEFMTLMPSSPSSFQNKPTGTEKCEHADCRRGRSVSSPQTPPPGASGPPRPILGGTSLPSQQL